MKRIMFALIMLVILTEGTLMAYDFSNDDIANKAATYVGQRGGQCKAFVQSVISQLGGELGAGYKQCYLEQGYEVTDHSHAMRGDIIQLYENTDPESYYKIMHTAIILENNNDGTFKVIDSNYCSSGEGANCEIVHQHIWNPYSHANKYSFQVHIFRIGNNNEYIRHKYDFLNGSSGGWTLGVNTKMAVGEDSGETWTIQVTGNNPGIVSPQFNKGMLARFTKLVFRVKVSGNGQSEKPIIWIKDEAGSWNNLVELSEIISDDQKYHIYQADLEKVYRQNLEIRQFSIELTDGENGDNEKWEFDWLKVINTDSGLFSKLYIASQPSGPSPSPLPPIDLIPPSHPIDIRIGY